MDATSLFDSSFPVHAFDAFVCDEAVSCARCLDSKSLLSVVFPFSVAVFLLSPVVVFPISELLLCLGILKLASGLGNKGTSVDFGFSVFFIFSCVESALSCSDF